MALKIGQDSNKAKGLCHLVIDEDMTIYVIDQLKQEISKILGGYKRFELDLSGIEEIDSAGIQLLLALKGELMQQQKSFKLSIASTPVESLLDTYGLADWFDKRGEL